MSKLQKLLAAEHPVGMSGKGLEEVELHAGEGNVGAGRVIEAVRSQIEGARAHSDDLRLRRAGRGVLSWSLAQPSQHALHAGKKLARIERFWNVIVRTHFQTDD